MAAEEEDADGHFGGWGVYEVDVERVDRWFILAIL